MVDSAHPLDKSVSTGYVLELVSGDGCPNIFGSLGGYLEMLQNLSIKYTLSFHGMQFSVPIYLKLSDIKNH